MNTLPPSPDATEPPNLAIQSKRSAIVCWAVVALICAAVIGLANLYNGAYLHIRVYEVDRIESIELRSSKNAPPYFVDQSTVSFDKGTGNAYFVVAPARRGAQELTASVVGGASSKQLSCTIDFRSWRCFSEVFISPDRMACTSCTMD